MLRTVLLSTLTLSPSGSPIQVRVEPRLEEMNLEAVDEIVEKVEDRVSATVTSEGHPVVPQADAQLTVRIEWDDATAAFEVAVTGKRGIGEPATVVNISCPQCRGTELVDEIDAVIPALVQEAFAVKAVQTVEPTPAEPAAPIVGAGGPSDGAAGRPRFGGLGMWGLGGVVLGGTTLGVGVGFAAVGRQRLEDEPWKFRNYRPAGIGLAVTGAVLVATGVALIVVDRRKQKRRVALVPTGLGALVSGSF